MTGAGVIFDLVAAQSPSYRGRGIDHYSTELVRAMVARHPELVSCVVVHPELALPEGLDDLAPWLTTEPDWASGSVLHLSSVFELEVPVRTFWPRQAATSRLLTAVTLYDLIPEVFPGWYLEDPGLRRRWRSCREVVRAADSVLCLSESARSDAIALLGLAEDRVTVIGSGTSKLFRPAKNKAKALAAAQAGVEGLEAGFVVYNGAFDPRKNVDRLVEGYSMLSPTLIRSHQLVIVCEAPPLTRNHYLVMAKKLGIEGRVLIPGFVPDEVLVALHQSAALGIFPSLYEGYGLPVVQSMACGAPNIVGNNSSLAEIVPREARFEPTDPAAIAQAITKALTDAQFRRRLVDLASHAPPSWEDVADRAACAFDALLARAATGRRPAWRKQPCLALVGFPDEIALGLGELCRCDNYALPDQSAGNSGAAGSSRGDGQTTGTGAELGSPARPLHWGALSRLDAWRGGYDRLLVWSPALGGADNDELAAAIAAWRERALLVSPPGLDAKAAGPASGESGESGADGTGTVGRKWAKPEWAKPEWAKPEWAKPEWASLEWARVVELAIADDADSSDRARAVASLVEMACHQAP